MIIETPEDSVIDFPILKDRVDKAIELIIQYGMIDGARHKQWVLDQTLRILLDSDYDYIMETQVNNDPDYEPWDWGITP